MANDPKQLKITDLVQDLPRLRVFDEELRAYEEENPFQAQYPVVDKQTYLGIEVEVENVHRFDRNSPYWTVIEDGSLRNRGHEFITHPLRAWRAEHALSKLFLALNKDIDFSERTSIHIHMNVRTLTVAQLEALILTYMVFEKSLFSFVGNNRYNNIFCVPITETGLGTQLTDLFNNNQVVLGWMKYTALNLIPIREKGTIEFRHLSGTQDIERLITWINIILSLKKFALKNPPEYIWNRIETLNTTSEYRMFGEEVFGNLIHTVFNESFNEDVGTCVTYVKSKCITNRFRDTLFNSKFSEKSPLLKLISPSLNFDYLEDLDQFIQEVAIPRNPVPRTNNEFLTGRTINTITQDWPTPWDTVNVPIQNTTASVGFQEAVASLDMQVERIREEMRQDWLNTATVAVEPQRAIHRVIRRDR